MALTKRVEILFDPEQYRAIEKLARSRGETVGALVRKAVGECYLQGDLEGRKVAIQRLLSMGESDLGTWEEAKEAIARQTVKRFEAP